MKTLVIASQKGGSGKSTVAVHLAVAAQRAGFETIIADLDPHSRSSAEWASERKVASPVVVTAHKEDIQALQAQAKGEGFDLLVIDCPPFVDDVVVQATELADYTLIPAQPRFNDMRTVLRLIDNVHPPFAIVLNACTPNIGGLESSKTREARDVLEEAGIPVSPIHIVRREAFADALNDGSAVLEFEPDGKAAHEINELWSWVKEVLNG